MNNKIIIITGLSGAGKSTLAEYLVNQYPDKYERVITSTTRNKREHENGDEYNYIKKEEFEKMIESKLFLEFSMYEGNYYGTRLCDIEKIINKNKQPVLILDIMGAGSFSCKYETVKILVISNSPWQQYRQLLMRDGKKEHALKRMVISEKELSEIKEIDYILINHDFNGAKKELCQVLENMECNYLNRDMTEHIHQYKMLLKKFTDMRYENQDIVWKKIFELEWEAVLETSKAIAAVIVDEDGEIISIGRNKVCEPRIPNPIILHAEVEAIRNLNIEKYPHTEKYTLYTGLEPCIMCMGTIAIGRIGKVVIAARDDYGGAMNLIRYSDFLKERNIDVLWLDGILGEVQRGFQTIRELLFEDDKEKLEKKIKDFRVHNNIGVEAAYELYRSNYIRSSNFRGLTVEEVFDALIGIIGEYFFDCEISGRE